MPEFIGLVLQSGHQMRVTMTKNIDGDAGGAIEKASAVGGLQPHTVTPHEIQVRAIVGLIEGCLHHIRLAPDCARNRAKGRPSVMTGRRQYARKGIVPHEKRVPPTRGGTDTRGFHHTRHGYKSIE